MIALRKRLLSDFWPGVVRQFDEIDCGPAALLTILRYYGGDANLSKVRDLAGTDARGTSLHGLAVAAERLGLRAEGASGELAALESAALPCIAHLVLPNGLEHYVVVFRVGRRRVRIADPAEGVRSISRGEFQRLWVSRSVLFVEPMATLVCAKPVRPLHWLAQNFIGSEPWLIQSIFAGLAYAALGIATSLCIQILIDRMIPAHAVRRVLALGGLLLVLTLVRSGVGLLRQHLLLELGRRVNSKIAAGFISRVFRLPLRFFDTRTKGDVAARMRDAGSIQTALMRVLGTSVTDLFVIAGALLYIAVLAPAFVPLALVSITVYGAAMAIVTRPLRTQQRWVMHSNAELEGAYVDSLNGINDIRAYSSPQLFERLNLGLFRALQRRTKSFGLTQARALMCAESVGGVLVLAALTYGALLVGDGAMKLGQMVAAYSLLASMVLPITRLVDAHIALQGASLAVARLTDLSEAEEERSIGTREFDLQREMRVRGIAFAWPRGDVLFTGLDMTIQCGRVTGMWGVSGSGKSTLVKLLQRLYVPAEGQILIDGISAEAIELGRYRRSIGVVASATKLFNLTLGENICLGREETPCTDPGLATAASLTQLREIIDEHRLTPFFARFEQGLSTRIGEGGRDLSSGERQVVGLLRALVGRPSLLVIDEGMNALDADMTRLVWEIIREFSSDHAVLVISHDVYSLAETDYVYVLDKGVITESGSPDTLLQRQGQFNHLWQMRDNPLSALRANVPLASRELSGHFA